MTDSEVDLLFHALADPTRRDILQRTLNGEASVSALAREYPMRLTAVQKHVAVLEKAGLVTKKRRGREQRVIGEMGAVARARHRLDQYERIWRGRIDRMQSLLTDEIDGGTR